MLRRTDNPSCHLGGIRRWSCLPDPPLPFTLSSIPCSTSSHYTSPRTSSTTRDVSPFFITPSISSHWPGPAIEVPSASESPLYAADNDGVVACACGEVFNGAAKDANANRKRHVQSHTIELTTGVNSHYAVDDGETVTCACGINFTGAAKNANANLKRHIQTYNNGKVFECPKSSQGYSYVAQRKDDVAAHYQRACRHGNSG